MIYFIGELGRDAKPNGIIKIGWTAGESADERLSSLQCGNARRLQVLKAIPGGRETERALHELFAEWRLEGEWFAFGKQATRVVGWQRVVCAQTLVAALGQRYAERARRLKEGPPTRYAPIPPLPEVKWADPHDAEERVPEDDPARPPAWLVPVIDPDDGPASGGAALPNPSKWARRIHAAAVLLGEAA